MTRKSSGSGSGRHVVPSGKGWDVKTPGKTAPESHHRTQGAAEREAKRQVRDEGGGEVRIHRPDGTIRDSDTVPPGHDPNPPKDKKH
jgi:hypothetical protein